MVLYLYEGDHRTISETFVRKACTLFIEEKKLAHTFLDLERAVIARTENGKPYFTGSPIHFSVSHTGSVWACLISRFNVGLDIQEERQVDCNRLAARIFTREEQEYVLQHGLSSFFDVWTFKEACVKYLGTGIAKDFCQFSVIQEGKLIKEIDLFGDHCFLTSLEVRHGIKCAICSSVMDLIEVSTIEKKREKKEC